ncbi:MAG: NAD(P)-dependent oxidoreductase, partial [Candidatus Latescibacteria bacterium]|nr:NAD(P)-dependent oxidoreductase [Candidatus Latescibacterota bacterium]
LGKPSPEAEKLGVEIVGLDELLERADFVSLHLPLTDQSRGLLSSDRLGRMKRGAYLINAARGEIVDEDALAELLHGGHLAGAGVDTFGVIEIFGERP